MKREDCFVVVNNFCECGSDPDATNQRTISKSGSRRRLRFDPADKRLKLFRRVALADPSIRNVEGPRFITRTLITIHNKSGFMRGETTSRCDY
jgi:hypothetical protein